MKSICDEALLIIDCTGILSKILDLPKLELPTQRLTFEFLKDSKSILTEAIFSQINFTSHEKLHLREALNKLFADEISINNLLNRLASSSNPFIHSPLDLISIEGLIFSLQEFSEIDQCINTTGPSLYDLVAEKENLIIDLSKICSTKARKLLAIMILIETYSNKNPFTRFHIFVEGPEGSSLLSNHRASDFYFELIDRLILNDVVVYFTANHGELDPRIISRFKTVYLIKHDGVFCFPGTEILSYKVGVDMMKLKLEDEEILLIERPSKPFNYATNKSILEMLYGDLSDLIADLIQSMENNMISKKEFKNLALSLGYFKESDELLDKLISGGLIEERIVGGIKKLSPTSKGLFLAKLHKFK